MHDTNTIQEKHTLVMCDSNTVFYETQITLDLQMSKMAIMYENIIKSISAMQYTLPPLLFSIDIQIKVISTFLI